MNTRVLVLQKSKMLAPAVNNIVAATKPWQMCSVMEGKDRQDHMELSELECTVDTYHLIPRERKADPTLCVKKYRRSAAGGGSTISEQIKLQSKVRSVQDLVTAVHHLLYGILATQRSHACMDPLPFCKVVSFVDDRIRAVQVDYVTYYCNEEMERNDAAQEQMIMSVIQMQFYTLNYHLLVGYLLTEMPSTKFEPKFNIQAMRTSFAHLSNILQRCLKGERTCIGFKDDVIILLDEIMCYESLLHLCAVIVEESTLSCNRPGMFIDHGSSISAIEALMIPTLLRKLISDKRPLSSLLPKWSWSLRVASAYACGNFLQWIRLFTWHPNEASGTLKDQCNSTNQVDSILIAMKHLSISKNDYSNAWITRCKLCVAPALPLVRINAIKQWNSAFMKCERVTATKLGDLLSFSSPNEAISFCKLLSLPTEVNEHGEEVVLFKTASSVKIYAAPSIIGCRQDDFVFGSKSANKSNSFYFMKDVDGIPIPSADFMRFLIFSS